MIDGSLFPAISTMTWAKYKEGVNALKMHLCFELNRMIPVHFLSTEGNFSEKAFLRDILEKGPTYICDRSYISFELFKRIQEEEAFFVIRGKSNLLFNMVQSMTVEFPECFLKFFDAVEDMIVVFKNDPAQIAYRVVKFASLGESYVLTTNRLDLTTYQIIMLYAYRWQIELYFRFLKRTLKGIHLWCEEPRGIEIQIYVFMIAHLLVLRFKQECQSPPADSGSMELPEKEVESASSETFQEETKDGRFYVRGLVSLLGDKLKKTWRISIQWLIALKNILATTMNSNSMIVLAKYA